MFEFIAKYWLEVLFGLITAALGFLCKYFYSLYKKDKHEQLNDELKEVKSYAEEQDRQHLEAVNNKFEELNKSFGSLTKSMEELEKSIYTMRISVLAIWGKQFKGFCKELLEEEHQITLEEYRKCCEEHDLYNGLGGNHDGDTLFSLVTTKYEANLQQ